MNVAKITDNIYYTGVNDRVTNLFEALWEIPNGVSYNSYIVQGKEKTALIDCVEIGEIKNLIDHIQATIGDKQLDYLVVNHMEPDHTGGIPMLLNAYPDLKLVGNKQTSGMLCGYYNVDPKRIIEVADNDILDLGELSMHFILTPMVHWPETMMTYIPERKLIFTGDALGCFGALNGGVIDEELETTMYFREMLRYYSNIVGKYGKFVKRALQKLQGLEIEYACSTHGPVWHKELAKVINAYCDMSEYATDPEMVTIIYGSMYGNTAETAEAIARALSCRGIKKIRVHNASKSSLSCMITDAFLSRTLIIGSPTYSMSLFPPVEQFIKAMTTREVKNKILATFGSYTWSPAAPKLLAKAAEDLNLPLVDEIQIKQAANPDTYSAIETLADKIIESLKENKGKMTSPKQPYIY